MKKELYCCSTTADWELFETPTKLYTTMGKLKKDHKCWKYCGITKITITTKPIVKGKKERIK